MGIINLTLGSGGGGSKKTLFTGILFQRPQLAHFILRFVLFAFKFSRTVIFPSTYLSAMAPRRTELFFQLLKSASPSYQLRWIVSGSVIRLKGKDHLHANMFKTESNQKCIRRKLTGKGYKHLAGKVNP